jgi:crotonobetainyl-CoA:carnitine CoA-transferase CaiB-like acyl-CoA transferase
MAGPLEGVRIVDITSMLSGPYATQILGDMGADVIKVEPPQGDTVRAIGPMRNPNMGPIYLHSNRSKRSIVLDLKHPSGRTALLQLAESADVFICNMRPQAMARLGLSYNDVAAINPSIIYLGILGYGQSGPYADRPAYDDLIQAAVGLPALSGGTGQNTPRYTPVAVADRVTALNAANAVTAALYHRERSGEGQCIEIPMFESLASMVLADHMAGQTFDPTLGPAGYARYASERRPFPTKDGYICTMIHTDKQWKSFVALAGREDLSADPRFGDVGSRTRNVESLYKTLADILATRTTNGWLEALEQADIPVMPLHTMESLLADPHLQAVGFFQVVDHPSEGPIRSMSVPARWSITQPVPTRHAPKLGENSIEVLREAGLDEDRINSMLAEGATVDSARSG